MAMAALQPQQEHLRALVDMGSNGIRFSISTLQPPTARVMPTLYQQRAAISLYDAQYAASGDRVPIDDQTINAVVASFRHFKQTCADFGVLEDNITVLATEATRTAINSEHFMGRIKDAVGWTVTLLPKEDEGRVGAMGVASSLPELQGLVMDLGGGSTQLSWIIKKSTDPRITMSKAGAVSLPYGAAAVTRRMAEAEKAGGLQELEREVVAHIQEAYDTLGVPQELEEGAKKKGGFTLFLSGGGFRGWGYILMSRHVVQPYPIPLINGFRTKRDDFLETHEVKEAAASALEQGDEADIFRVSDRRAGQVPAVSFLITAISKALPHLKEVRFCQGGVREGYLFSSLPADIRAQHPLVVATQPFAISKAPSALVALLRSALPPAPPGREEDALKNIFHDDILTAFSNLMYFHASHSKDIQSTAALRSTTSGALASVHGLLHESRTLLALLLCARWGGPVPPTEEQFKRNLERLVDSPLTIWWVNYIGAVAALVASVFPAGVTSDDQQRLRLEASWETDEKQRPLIALRVTVASDVDPSSFGKEAHSIEKVGKKKRWIGGREGFGHKVDVHINPGESK